MRNTTSVMLGSFIVFTLFLSTGVFAEYHKINESKRNDYTAILQHINCRIQLTEKQLDLLSVANSSITSYKSPLDADYTKLQEFATALNHKEFTSYITTTFKDNLKSAVKAVQDTKKDLKRANLTQEQKQQLKDGHKEAIAGFANCTNDAAKNWSEARRGYLNAWIERWKNIISKMNEKGYDTAEMEAVVSDAQSKLIPALEAIKNAATPGLRKTAMENARILHLHLWARFEIARLNSYLKSIEANATAAGYGSDVDAIKAKLAEASKLAPSGKRYGPGEFETTWKAIKDAAQMLRELNRKLK